MPPCVEGTLYVNRNARNPYVNIALCINVVDGTVIALNTFDRKSEFRGVLCRVSLKDMCQIGVAIGVGLRGDSGVGHRQLCHFKFAC